MEAGLGATQAHAQAHLASSEPEETRKGFPLGLRKGFPLGLRREHVPADTLTQDFRPPEQGGEQISVAVSHRGCGTVC